VNRKPSRSMADPGLHHSSKHPRYGSELMARQPEMFAPVFLTFLDYPEMVRMNKATATLLLPAAVTLTANDQASY